MTEITDKKTYQQTLPKKRVSAGCLFFDEHGRLLVVNPTYKKPWEIPGGTVEANESPRQAIIREVKEELGLTVEPGPLLGVDYGRETKKRTERLQFIFDGGTLTAAQIAAIRLPAEELSEYRFLAPREALKLLNKKLRRRVRHCLRVRDGEDARVYLEEQRPIKHQTERNQV